MDREHGTHHDLKITLYIVRRPPPPAKPRYIPEQQRKKSPQKKYPIEKIYIKRGQVEVISGLAE